MYDTQCHIFISRWGTLPLRAQVSPSGFSLGCSLGLIVGTLPLRAQVSPKAASQKLKPNAVCTMCALCVMMMMMIY